MHALICDNCGKEHRQHRLNDLLTPSASGWWTRHTFTTNRSDLQLIACSEPCATDLDATWPTVGPCWRSMSMTGKEDVTEREYLDVAVPMPSTLPAPPEDANPHSPPMPCNG